MNMKMNMKMKKIYPLILLLTGTLFLNSCLGEGNNNYSDTTIVYIDSHAGTIYGKTLTSRFITSSQMQLMMPGTFKFFSYAWDEEYGTSMIGEMKVDNVVITRDPEDVSLKTLSLSAPPEVEEPDMFLDISEPYYANNKLFLGDHWLFEYAYEAKKDEDAVIQFYMVDDPELGANEVLLEIRLVIEGEPAAGASLTSRTDIVALNIGPLRSYLVDQSQVKRDVKIQFQYYRKGSTELYKIPNSYILTVGEDA